MRNLLLTIVLSLFSFGTAWGQETPPVSAPVNSPAQAPSTAQVQTEPIALAPVAELPHPEWYAVSFLPLVKGNKSVAFVVSPAGKLGTIPMDDIGQAYKSGYRPFTVADLLAITNSIADEEKNSQRKIKELSEDYDALAARYNRLALVNSTPVVQAQPAFDERQAMRAMVFRSLLQRAFPAPAMRIQVQTVDCNKFPALCVNH